MSLSRLCCRNVANKLQTFRQPTRSVVSFLSPSSSLKNVFKAGVLLRAAGIGAGVTVAVKLLVDNKVGVVFSKENEVVQHIVEQDEDTEIAENVLEEKMVADASSSFFGVPMCFWKEVYSVAKGQLWVLAIAVVSAFASAYFNVKISWQIGDLINVISRYIPPSHGDGQAAADAPDFAYLSTTVMKPLLNLVVSYCAQSAATFSYITAMSYFGENLNVELKIRIVERLLLMDAEYYDRRHRIGDLLNNITHDTHQFKSAFKQVVGQGLKNTVQIVGCAYSLFVISPTLTMFLGVPLCGMIAVGSAIGRILRNMSSEAQGDLAKATSFASESLYGVSTIRAFAAEKDQTHRYSRQLRDKFLRSSVALGSGIAMLQALTNLAINGMVVGVVFLGGWQISTGNISAGELMSFLMASQSLQRCMAQTSVLVSDVIKGCSAASRISEILSLQPAIQYSGGRKLPFHSLIGDIEFKDVVFTYKSRHRLHDFEYNSEETPESQSAIAGMNFTIPGGSIVAITGPSGAGKSTLASLLERFYDPTKGSIFLDKIDLRLYDLGWLRHRAIGYVGQEPVLFAGTVSDNIRFGRPEASDQEVREAAQAASADLFIRNELPNGYDTMIGERGVLLSGGQKQRIALARALIKDPPILVLDEITSALDAESERAIHRALETGSPHGRTVVMITHRLNWARSADKIIVVDGGKVVEEGKHEALLARKGLYWKLWNEQHKADQSHK